MTHVERFMSRTTPQPDGCWHWTGYLTKQGYPGHFRWDGFRTAAHRAAHLFFIGPIPDTTEVDHACHDPEICHLTTDCPHRRCVNPAHLQAISRRENVIRSNNRAGRSLRQNMCPRGHDYKQTTTQRYCPTCTNENSKRRYHGPQGAEIRERRNARLRQRYAEQKTKGQS